MRLVALGIVFLLAACVHPHPGTPAAAGQNYVIFFQSFSANLDDAAQGAIQAAAASARAHPGVPITVAGYASPVGSAQANADLSRTRAQVVSDGLVSHGVEPGRIKRKALGEVDYTLDPVESRRVEISVGL